MFQCVLVNTKAKPPQNTNLWPLIHVSHEADEDSRKNAERAHTSDPHLVLILLYHFCLKLCELVLWLLPNFE